MKNAKFFSVVSTLFMLTMSIGSCAQNNVKQKNKSAGMITVKTENLDTALFGAGCFWCVEAVFQRLNGVEKVVSGYGGGHVENPTYEEVCDKTTGHVELCQIVYDTTLITYDELLEVFWKTHDPTTPNQQGNDIGPQYRSAIFYKTETEKQKAESYKAALDKSGAWDKPIVTTIEPFKNFYPAENYHQNYYNDNQNQGYCRYVIKPKLEKFEKVFKNKLKQPN